MSFIIKLSAGIYIVSVLAFSSWSRALDVLPVNDSIEGFDFNTSKFEQEEQDILSSEGYVFEHDGYLFFQSENGHPSLIHSNSFELFEGATLPVKVSVQGLSLVRGSYDSNLNNMLEIIDLKFL